MWFRRKKKADRTKSVNVTADWDSQDDQVFSFEVSSDVLSLDEVASSETGLESRIDAVAADVASLRKVVDSLLKHVPDPGVLVIKESELGAGDDLDEEYSDDSQFDLNAVEPDEAYVNIIREFIGRAPISKVSGDLMNLTIVGELQDGSIAWVNEDLQTFGQVPKSIFDDEVPLPDDQIRARVVSYPWGHHVTAVVPQSIYKPFAARPISNVSTSVGTVPATVAGSFCDNLKPGDLVSARVAYDGTSSNQHDGRIAKVRPAVFLRWENDYAVLRAIYGAKGYVAGHGLGVALADTRDLKKKSVVRNAEYDVDAKHLIRKIGRLGTRDLLALNIDDVDTPNQGIRRNDFSVLRSTATDEGTVDTVHRELNALVAAVMAENPVTSEETLRTLLNVMRENRAVANVLCTEGVHFAMVGHVLSQATMAMGYQVQRGGLSARLNHLIDSDNLAHDLAYACRHDSNNHPVLWLVESHSVVGTEADTGVLKHGNDLRLEIPDEYFTPDLIIYDQQSMQTILRGRHLDMATLLKDLRAGSTSEGYVIGANSEDGLMRFQHAASVRGWGIEVADDRGSVIEAAHRLARESAAVYITVVGKYADLIAELENSNYEVTIIGTPIGE